MSDFAQSYLWVVGGLIAVFALAWLGNRVFGNGGRHRDDSFFGDDRD
ncbi:MAG: hypothetical protein AAGF51_15825 [Pseudomonadota bacterium]